MLKITFAKTDYKKSRLLIEQTEKRFFNWIFKVMKDNTTDEDVVKSLLLLPKYFNIEIIEPVFAKFYPVIKRNELLHKIIRKIGKILHIIK